MVVSRKIGPYIIGGTNVALRRSDARPAFVMLVDCSPEYYAQVRAMMGPETLIEMRWTERDDYQPLDDPERRADEWWERRKAAILAAPASDRVVFAGYNEIGTDQAAAFAQFELRRLAHLHAAGRHAAVGSWGVGHPDMPEWASYAPLRTAMRVGDVWDAHEYASDLADIDNRWHVGRFTRPEALAVLGDWPLVVSECGYDIVEGRGQPGWRLTTDATGCIAMLRKFGVFYDMQKRVLGAAAFQIGSQDRRFANFDMYGVWPQVVSEYPTETQTVPAPTPAPPATITLMPPIAKANIAHNPDGSLRITQRFGGGHYGIDYSCVKGTPVYAAIDGQAYAEDQGDIGFGRYVRIEGHDSGGRSLYVYTAHLSAWLVSGGGPMVHAGDRIGLSGSTGNSTGPHLHFEIRRGSRLQASAIDPEPLIVWPQPEGPLAPFLPTNDPTMLARRTPQDRYQGVRWWLEHRKRQHEAGKEAYADAIDAALIELMYRWERE